MTTTPFVPSDAGSLRSAIAADGAALAAIYAPSVTASAFSFELVPPDAAEMAARVERTLPALPWLVCEREGRVCGYAYASRYRERPAYRWSVEVSAYVDAAARGRGIARALYTTLLDILTLQQYRNAYAAITLPNEASVRLHEALGFTPLCIFRGVGYKHGAWHDVGWYERALLPRVADPAGPTAFHELAGTPALRDALAAGASVLASSTRRQAAAPTQPDQLRQQRRKS